MGINANIQELRYIYGQHQNRIQYELNLALSKVELEMMTLGKVNLKIIKINGNRHR